MKSLQIVGPYFTNFSYARVNRGLAIALDKLQTDYKVNLYSDKDKIDWLPTKEELSQKPELEKLVKFDREETDVVIYFNFPKSISNLNNLKDLPGKIKLMIVAWEESIYPQLWVKEINDNIHGVMATSTFTKDVLINSGVEVPITVVPCALDNSLLNIKTSPYPLETTKTFKFLHISTAKVRKGVDVLLKAYFDKFTNEDDVTLIIKSSPGPDNAVDELISKLKKDNSPEVIHINNPDLTEQDLANLHSTADCEVYPSRAEGFGLTLLESMYFGIPLIATNYSSYLDFCN